MLLENNNDKRPVVPTVPDYSRTKEIIEQNNEYSRELVRHKQRDNFYGFIEGSNNKWNIY